MFVTSIAGLESHGASGATDETAGMLPPASCEYGMAAPSSSTDEANHNRHGEQQSGERGHDRPPGNPRALNIRRRRPDETETCPRDISGRGLGTGSAADTGKFRFR